MIVTSDGKELKARVFNMGETAIDHEPDLLKEILDLKEKVNQYQKGMTTLQLEVKRLKEEIVELKETK